MHARIRKYHGADTAPIVELSLLAWEPVFASLQRELGEELFVRLHGDWRRYQATAVRGVLANDAIRTWVAITEDRAAGTAGHAGDRVAGFVAAGLNQGDARSGAA